MVAMAVEGHSLGGRQRGYYSEIVGAETVKKIGGVSYLQSSCTGVGLPVAVVYCVEDTERQASSKCHQV